MIRNKKTPKQRTLGKQFILNCYRHKCIDHFQPQESLSLHIQTHYNNVLTHDQQIK